MKKTFSKYKRYFNRPRFQRFRKGGRSIFKSIFNIAKSPAGMIIIAICVIIPFLIPSIGNFASGIAEKIKSKTS
jgi:hypothetical protein